MTDAQLSRPVERGEFYHLGVARTQLSQANLENITFSGANLGNADFSRFVAAAFLWLTSSRGADFSNADLTDGD